MYFIFGPCGSVLPCAGCSLVAADGLLFVVMLGRLLAAASLLWSQAPQRRLSSCRHTGSAAVRLLGSSWTRDRSGVPRPGYRILIHWTPREVGQRCFKHQTHPHDYWTATYQAPPSMGFSRQEYWSGVPLPSLIHMHSCSQFCCFMSQTQFR